MSTPEVVGPPAQTAAMTTLSTQRVPRALAVRCPICDVLPNKSCEDAVRGWIRPVAPHLYRAMVAAEVTE